MVAKCDAFTSPCRQEVDKRRSFQKKRHLNGPISVSAAGGTSSEGWRRVEKIQKTHCP